MMMRWKLEWQSSMSSPILDVKCVDGNNFLKIWRGCRYELVLEESSLLKLLYEL